MIWHQVFNTGLLALVFALLAHFFFKPWLFQGVPGLSRVKKTYHEGWTAAYMARTLTYATFLYVTIHDSLIPKFNVIAGCTGVLLLCIARYIRYYKLESTILDPDSAGLSQQDSLRND